MTFNPTTFVFELVNFVVLAVVLHRIVYRPVAAAIADRRSTLASTQAAAAAKLAEADTRVKALEARHRELDQLREQIFAEATADAGAQRAKLLAQAREDAAAERDRVQSRLEADREAALGWVREVAVDRGAEVAGRLMLALVPDAVHEALVRRLVDSLADRRSELEAVSNGEVEATYARLPSREEAETLKAAVEDIVGPVKFSVAEDGRLGAGVALRVGDRTFDATVLGQLDLLREEARRHLGSEP